jgi:hypothetical protein
LQHLISIFVVQLTVEIPYTVVQVTIYSVIIFFMIGEDEQGAGVARMIQYAFLFSASLSHPTAAQHELDLLVVGATGFRVTIVKFAWFWLITFEGMILYTAYGEDLDRPTAYCYLVPSHIRHMSTES